MRRCTPTTKVRPDRGGVWHPRGIDIELGIPGIVDPSPIGRGGFAVVYRARQPAFGRIVAVKVITGATDDAQARERFERECQTMGALSDHPGIVTVHDAGVTPRGHPYLVMAHQAGGSLRRQLTVRGALGWEEAARVGIQVAGALAAAHRLDIVHRDVKPANVLVSAYGGVQLADFGIARIAGGPETRTDRVHATLQYAPPEVLAGQRPTPAGDVYALGATMFELAVGDTAFAGPVDEPPATLIARVLKDPVPDAAGHGVPRDLADLMTAAMAKDPAARPADADEFVASIASVLRAHRVDIAEDGPAPVGPESPSTKAASPPADGPDATAPPTVAAATVGHEQWNDATVAAGPLPFQPSHLVPAHGLAAWSHPDAHYPAAAVLDPALPVQILQWWGEWAEVRCSNGWVAWVGGRELVPWYG
jgi:serine/threonine-protein kinase PknK